MKRIVAYVTGAIALLVVAISIVGAVIYAVQNGIATLTILANSTLSGIGMAVGGLLGSFLVLRFKAARRFIGNTVKDIKAPLPLKEIRVQEDFNTCNPAGTRNDTGGGDALK